VPKENIKVIFVGAIIAVLLGSYYISKSIYTSIAWTKTEGIVIDFERHSMTCGKSVGECYTLIVGYHVDNKYYTATSKKKFSRNKPTHLLDEKLGLYYSPENPSKAILSGAYGPKNYGVILFLIGTVVLFIFWIVRKREQ